eukprot:Gb_27787 [translate_table: standard]
MAISSTSFVLKLEDVVASLLSEEMRQKSFEDPTKDALSIRGHSPEKKKNKLGDRQWRSRGKTKSPRRSRLICWNHGKPRHVKRDCKVTKPDKGKSPDATTFTEMKTSSDEVGDVYLASSSTHSCHDTWLIDSSASFHMTLHREWFCEYESYDGGDVFLGDDSSYKIIGRGRVKVRFRDGGVKTLPGVLHIPGLARNLLSVSKMSDAGIQVIFNKESCKMVQGVMVLAKGVCTRTLYKLEVSTVSDGYNSYTIGEDIVKQRELLHRPLRRQCYGIGEWAILERKVSEL